MAFKKPADKHSILKKNKVRVKNSYYTFSKEYPVGSIGKQRRSSRKRNGKKHFFRTLAAVCCFLIIAFAAYFVTELCIKISYKDISPETTSAQNEEADNAGTLLTKDGVRAFVLPADKIADTQYVKKLIRLIQKRDCNSVVIDFKTQSGKLAYSSSVETAMVAKCALYDNETVRKTLSLFQNKRINVIAGIYCFEDNLIASSNEDLAVKYMNSDVTWLDAMNEENGKAWLNPYSKEAQNYIKQIIEEVSSFGVKGFILKSVSFPTGGATETAGYPGEKKKSERNKTLLSFIESVKTDLPSDCFLLVSQTAQDTENGNDDSLFGSLNACNADGLCIDTKQRPSGYVIDKKTKFSSILSLFSKLKGELSQTQEFVPAISADEYTTRYLHAITKNGYKSFIVYSEDGEY
ncbi:MAG: putative glycoside hydrolase [Acutalibacteraceae bacterium]